MSRRVLCAFLSLIMIVSACPMLASASGSAADDEVKLILSADSNLPDTIDVSVYVKSVNHASREGAYAYFVYDSDKLAVVDAQGNRIDIAAMTNGVTFKNNKIDAVDCVGGWSDDSSFVKTISGGMLVGLEVIPDEETDISDGVAVAYIRLKIVGGDFGDYQTDWITPVREKTDALAFASALYTVEGKSEPAPELTESVDFVQLSCAHSFSELIVENPSNGKSGTMYYICSQCGLHTGVTTDENGQSVPIEKAASTLNGNPLYTDNETVIPAVDLNNLITKTADGKVIGNYPLRGASLRLTQPLDNNYIDMRFTASVQIPQGAKIVDFGMIYTLASSILKDGCEVGADASLYDTEKLVLDGVDGDFGVNQYGINVAVLSYKQITESGSKFYFTTYDSESGVTGKSIDDTEQIDSANYISYNLVVSQIKSENYARYYAVRAYCTYNYLGRDFTVYDGADSGSALCSARSVYYIAEKAYASASESEYAKQYIYQKVLTVADPQKYPAE